MQKNSVSQRPMILGAVLGALTYSGSPRDSHSTAPPPGRFWLLWLLPASLCTFREGALTTTTELLCLKGQQSLSLCPTLSGLSQPLPQGPSHPCTPACTQEQCPSSGLQAEGGHALTSVLPATMGAETQSQPGGQQEQVLSGMISRA